jgi:hypothetical protein
MPTHGFPFLPDAATSSLIPGQISVKHDEVVIVISPSRYSPQQNLVSKSTQLFDCQNVITG